MQRVFVLDKNKIPLSPCSPARARILLSKGKAVVFRLYPFTIYVGRVAIRSNGYFNITTDSGLIQGISYQYCRLLHRNDSYNYSNQKREKR